MLQRLWPKVETPFLFSLLKALGLDVQEELECLRVFRYQEKGSQYFWNLESRLVLAQHVIPLALVVSLLVVLALHLSHTLLLIHERSYLLVAHYSHGCVSSLSKHHIRDSRTRKSKSETQAFTGVTFVVSFFECSFSPTDTQTQTLDLSLVDRYMGGSLLMRR